MTELVARREGEIVGRRPTKTSVTVLFCDLRGSCGLADLDDGKQDRLAAWAGLNEALEVMTDAVVDEGASSATSRGTR